MNPCKIIDKEPISSHSSISLHSVASVVEPSRRVTLNVETLMRLKNELIITITLLRESLSREKNKGLLSFLYAPTKNPLQLPFMQTTTIMEWRSFHEILHSLVAFLLTNVASLHEKESIPSLVIRAIVKNPGLMVQIEEALQITLKCPNDYLKDFTGKDGFIEILKVLRDISAPSMAKDRKPSAKR